MRLTAVAVLVITSAMVGVVGAVAVPTAAHADMRTPAVGNSAPAATSPTLDAISRLQASQLPNFASQHADDILAVRESRLPASTIAAWWRDLGNDKRSQLVASAPQFVGALDGVPFSVRDEANRAALAHSITSSSQAMHMLPSTYLARIHAVASASAPALGGPERQLLLFDTSGDWRTSIAVGDPATADFVTYLVPGMSVSVAEQAAAWADRAQALYNDQLAWLSRLGSSATVAVIAWMGYNSPQVASEVTELEAAVAGAQSIESDLRGLFTARRELRPHVTVVAHSYGSTAALLALQSRTVSVDSLVVLGSPGSDALSADALAVTPGNVYAASAAFDPVAASGYFGSNPMRAGYGAKILSVAGGVDPATCQVFVESLGHNQYFLDGSRSMRNLALVGIGRGDLASVTSRDE